jgi:hypothetical protein
VYALPPAAGCFPQVQLNPLERQGHGNRFKNPCDEPWRSNSVAAGAWALHGAGCLTSPRVAVSGLSWVARVLTISLRVETVLLCGSGAVGIAASCVVLQHGSIQLVQVPCPHLVSLTLLEMMVNQ